MIKFFYPLFTLLLFKFSLNILKEFYNLVQQSIFLFSLNSTSSRQKMKQNLTNKVAYITGGTKGIGKGIAEELLKKGIRVAISSRTLKQAEEVAAKLGNTNQIIGLQSNVCEYNNETKAVEQILEHFGQLDFVIANAGLGHFAPITELTIDQWKQTIDTNLTGVFHTTKASLSALEQSKGYLITIASLAGTNFFEKGAAYNASKFGLVGFTQAIMLDLRKKGIKVTTIMPGSVATHFNGNEPSEKDAWKIQPEDIGQMVINLLEMNPRTLPSKVEVRPSFPHLK